MSFLARMVTGGSNSSKTEQQNRQGEVEKLCNRLSHAALLEDRRSAAQAIKAVSKQYQTEIGNIGFTSLLDALKRDNEEEELSRSILETLITILSGNDETDMKKGLCEMFLKDKKTIEVVFRLLKEGRQYVRYDVLQLMTVVEGCLPHRLPATILTIPTALSTIIEMLDDANEVIRNDALLLFQKITENSSEIQRVAAFEGSFEKLVELVFNEGGVFGGEATVEDAMIAIQNMLRYNPSNQTYFRESPCLGKLKLLIFPDIDSSQFGELTAQVGENYAAAIGVICLLTNRDSPKLELVQNCLYKTGILGPLTAVAFRDGMPLRLQRSAMIATDSLLYNNPLVQDAFSKLVVDDVFESRPVPVVLTAIRAAVNGNDDSLRYAAVNMLGSYLNNNTDGQLVIAATFKSPIFEKSSSSSVDEQSAGSVIIERILDLSSTRKDSKKILFATLLLSHILRDNDQCKSIALQHHISDDELLFNRVVSHLNDSIKDIGSAFVFSAVAYLILLCTWMCGYSPATKLFLAEGKLINQNSTVDPMIQGCAAFLFGLSILSNDNSQGQFTRKTLEDIVKSRIGIDVFFARIARIRDILLCFKVGLEQLPNELSCDMAFVDLFLSKYETILGIFVSTRSSPGGLIATRQEKSIETIDLQGLQFNVPATIVPVNNDKNIESKCAYLVSENARLQKSIDMYSNQLLQIEKDHEELLMILASYDNELKQLRQHLTLAEQNQEASDGLVINLSSDVDLTKVDHPVYPTQQTLVESSSKFIDQDHPIPMGELYTTELGLLPSSPDYDSILEISEVQKQTQEPAIQVEQHQLLSPKKPSTTTHEV